MKRSLILAIGLSLALAGCSHDRDVVIAPEVYDEPPAPVFTDAEQGLLDAIAGKPTAAAKTFVEGLDDSGKAALIKLQPIAHSMLEKMVRQKNAYRATVKKHNAEARRYAQDVTKDTLHVDDGKLKKLMSNEEP